METWLESKIPKENFDLLLPHAFGSSSQNQVILNFWEKKIGLLGWFNFGLQTYMRDSLWLQILRVFCLFVFYSPLTQFQTLRWTIFFKVPWWVVSHESEWFISSSQLQGTLAIWDISFQYGEGEGRGRKRFLLDSHLWTDSRLTVCSTEPQNPKLNVTQFGKYPQTESWFKCSSCFWAPDFT